MSSELTEGFESFLRAAYKRELNDFDRERLSDAFFAGAVIASNASSMMSVKSEIQQHLRSRFKNMNEKN